MPKSETGSTPVPPSVAKELSVKEQRTERRAAKVAVLKKQQQREKRNRTLAIVGGSVAVAAIAAVIVTSVVQSAQPETPIAGLQLYPNESSTHVTSPVSYDVTPPVGGNHYGQWLNCGIYTEPVPTENAVHVLEHGAVWVTYDPALVTGAALTTLQGEVPKTYSVLSPWVDLGAPVVISAWGAQVKLTGVDDPRLDQFVTKYWQSPAAPEPGAACVGGLDAPGRIA
jgi:hypothetical protein